MTLEKMVGIGYIYISRASTKMKSFCFRSGPSECKRPVGPLFGPAEPAVLDTRSKMNSNVIGSWEPLYFGAQCRINVW